MYDIVSRELSYRFVIKSLVLIWFFLLSHSFFVHILLLVIGSEENLDPVKFLLSSLQIFTVQVSTATSSIVCGAS